MNPITRILNRNFAFECDNDSVEDIDIFMDTFGKSLGYEIMFLINQAMNANIDPTMNVAQYKLSFTLEKCKEFQAVTGEHIE